MKIKLLPWMVYICVLTIFSTSCSSDNDKNDEPEGIITLNMLDENNGKTRLGDTDIYIDEAYNFHGDYCFISSLGKKNGLKDISSTPVLKGLSYQTAVEPGNAYQIFSDESLKTFESGNFAIPVRDIYYNVYVDSDIIQNEEIVGATVKYVHMEAPTYGLPIFNTNIGTMNAFEYYLTIDLPTADCEYEFIEGANIFDHEKEGNKLIITLLQHVENDNFGIYIRVKESYTYVYGKVE